MHQRTSLNEIAIYISHQLNYNILPKDMYFIVKENDFDRTMTNFDMTIRSIIECYTHNSTITIYYNYT